MSEFTQAEIEYLRDQKLGRLATVNGKGEPHVVPVGFRFNPDLDTVDIGGHNLAASKKFRDAKRDSRVAFVVDDVLPPWQPRGIEVRGRAEVLAEGGEEVGPGFDAEVIRIHPQRIVGWGIDSGAFNRNSRSVGKESDRA